MRRESNNVFVKWHDIEAVSPSIQIILFFLLRLMLLIFLGLLHTHLLTYLSWFHLAHLLSKAEVYVYLSAQMSIVNLKLTDWMCRVNHMFFFLSNAHFFLSVRTAAKKCCFVLSSSLHLTSQFGCFCFHSSRQYL